MYILTNINLSQRLVRHRPRRPAGLLHHAQQGSRRFRAVEILHQSRGQVGDLVDLYVQRRLECESVLGKLTWSETIMLG